MYTPNYLTEHDWNTALVYTCDADYHYVSGVNVTTCNETGEFPPVDFDCSGNVSVITPSNFIEYDWNTVIVYTCDAVYHYVRGVNITTCNETGECPRLEFDCLGNVSVITPSNITEHDWNTTITYTCDSDYHYNSDHLQ